MMKRDGASGGRNLDEKIKLPLTQTVFLPKEAMGVRYIDKVRASVFAEKISPTEQGFWLRGFFELTLEYQGVEGRGLCKHRVTLPLKMPVVGWLHGAQLNEADVTDLHAAVKHPMIKLLSPYVLEFSAELVLEYLGDCRWQEDRLQPPAPLSPKHGRKWQSDLPMPDEDKEGFRLESKIDHFFLGKAADSVKSGRPRMISSNGILDKDNTEGGSVEKDKQAVAELSAGDSEHRLPVWQYQQKESVQSVGAGMNSETEPKIKSRIVEMPKSRVPVFAGKNVDTQATTVNRVENQTANQTAKSVEKSIAKPQKAIMPDPTLEQIYASGLNKNRFRSMLTAAAISRLQARGENLTTEVGLIDEEIAKLNKKVSDSVSDTEVAAKTENSVENNGKSENIREVAAIRETENVAAEVENMSGEETKAEMKVEIIADKGADGADMEVNMRENIKEADMIEEKKEDKKEDKIEAVAADVSAEMNEKSAVEETQAEEAQAIRNEMTAEVVQEVTSENQTSAEGGSVTVAETAENLPTEELEVTADVPTDEETVAAMAEAAAVQPAGVEMVNNRGVKVRLAAKSAPRQAAPTAAPTGGFSIKYYVVKPGDDAMSVALKHNISIERLRDANRLPEGELAAGTLLRIPR